MFGRKKNVVPTEPAKQPVHLMLLTLHYSHDGKNREEIVMPITGMQILGEMVVYKNVIENVTLSMPCQKIIYARTGPYVPGHQPNQQLLNK